MFDLVSLGEMLIDFTPIGLSANGNPIFEQNPGGGPANMACAAAKLGTKTAFLGKVGKDAFGAALKKTLDQNGINSDRLILSPEYPTTLAFVHLDATGDRSFSFYRHNGADTMLEPSEIDFSILDQCRFFFCSSVLMAEGPSRNTSFVLLDEAKKRGISIVFDPNLRPNLWADLDDMKKQVLRAMELADILKISEDEATFLTGLSDPDQAAAALMKQFPVKLLLITLGKDGSVSFTRNMRLRHEEVPAKTVDTTAAGDSFTGGLVAELSRLGKPVDALSEQELWEAIRFANAVGALTTTKKGSISALPTRAEVEKLLAENPG